MRLRRVEILRFRGVQALDWKHVGDNVALVGSGDSGKSTILDAIERVLSPRWNLAFDDSDFWNLDTSNPLVIRATLTNISDGLAAEPKFGHMLQSFNQQSGSAEAIVDDKQEGDTLVIELEVGTNLEPTWSVVDGQGRRHHISARDREELGMVRVGGVFDTHLTWSRGSALAKLTAKGQKGDLVSGVLADALRQARGGLDRKALARLTAAAERVAIIASAIGVAAASKLGPHLDMSSLSVAGGVLALHDGEVPLRRAGLGTRRLLTIAMQREASADGGLTIIDEFENGLEPHRIRRLLRVLRGKPPEGPAAGGQLLLTTHSPTVLSELRASEVCVTHRDKSGTVRVVSAPEPLDPVIRHVPTALLGRKVIVGEGITEVGLCNALDEAWTAETGGTSFAYKGVAIVDGVGSDQPAKIAGALFDLGYSVALLVDSDAKAKIGRAKGALVLPWPGGVCTEQRLAEDLPASALCEMADYAAGFGGIRSVRDSLAAALGVKLEGEVPAEWAAAVDSTAFRKAIGKTANARRWFKTKEKAEFLGVLVARNWIALEGTPTRQTLDRLRTFAHGD